MTELGNLWTFLLAWCYAHPTVTALVVLPLVSALCNWALAFFTGPYWLDLLERYPRVAALSKLLEHAGFSPIKFIQWAKVLVTGKLGK